MKSEDLKARLRELIEEERAVGHQLYDLREIGETLGASVVSCITYIKELETLGVYRPRLDKEGADVSRGLEVLNYTNMLHFYREELREVDSTGSAEILSETEAKVLRKAGIIHLLRGGGQAVSWPARTLLDRLKAGA